MRKIPEVLAPAGDMERLDAALQFGADAVYLAASEYGMRTAPANFDQAGLKAAVAKAHAVGVPVYVTCNILPRNAEIDRLPAYLEQVCDAGADALIVADFGVMRAVKRLAPSLPLHVSTQFGVVNYATAQELYDQGASRVVLARELSLDEIAEIRARTSPALELECFVHGAMCMSFSGRCLLSNYLVGRDANHGDCAQPCRWRYHLTEAEHPDRELTLEQTDEGSFVFNANDLNMLAHLPALAQAGVTSFKIEGRAKAAYYVATVTGAYRAAVDGYLASCCSADYVPAPWMLEELEKVSHRPYGTGFYFGMPQQNLSAGGYIRHWQVAAVAEEWRDGVLYVRQRNRFFVGETLDVRQPNVPPFPLEVVSMIDEDGNSIESAPHPTMRCAIPCPRPVVPGALLRRACGGQSTRLECAAALCGE